MAKAVKELEYVVQQDFEALIEQTAEEFNQARQEGLPDLTVLSREFTVDEDCTAQIHSQSVPLKAKQKIKDPGLAWRAIRQGHPISIRSKVRFTKGDILLEDLALSLIEQEKPVASQEKKPVASQEEQAA